MFVDIITKAICGKGKKLEHSFHDIDIPFPVSNLLGCWVFNHHYSAEKTDDIITVHGAYDIHLWYAYDHETKTDVARATVEYNDEIPISIDRTNLISEDLDIIVKVLQQPNCVDTTFKAESEKVKVKTERELLAIVIGETKLKVEAKDMPEFT